MVTGSGTLTLLLPPPLYEERQARNVPHSNRTLALSLTAAISKKVLVNS